ncbi:hypothetical protein ADK77_18380, partial [Streptomyces antibioticus]
MASLRSGSPWPKQATSAPRSSGRSPGFATEQEAAVMLPPVRYERLRWALRARERGSALYLE